MINSKSFKIVTISTILFGVLSKWFVGIPYMDLQYFDLHFVIAFMLWAVYSTSLYVAGKINCNENIDFIKTSCHGFLFGMIVSCLKTGADSLVTFLMGKAENQILFAFLMEIVILLFGSVIMLFVFTRLHKEKFAWDKSLNKAAIILGCLTGAYVVAFFSFNAKYQALMRYTDVNTVNLRTLLGMESIMRYGKTFTLLSMIVWVVFFIGVWFVLEKGCNKSKS